jgi:hypothetical protein
VPETPAAGVKTITPVAHMDTDIAEAGQRRDRRMRRLHQHMLGDLDAQIAPLHADRRHRGGQLRDELRVGELTCRQVERQPLHADARGIGAPARQVGEGEGSKTLGHQGQQSRLLGYQEEVVWRDQAALAVDDAE